MAVYSEIAEEEIHHRPRHVDTAAQRRDINPDQHLKQTHQKLLQGRSLVDVQAENRDANLSRRIRRVSRVRIRTRSCCRKCIRATRATAQPRRRERGKRITIGNRKEGSAFQSGKVEKRLILQFSHRHGKASKGLELRGLISLFGSGKVVGARGND